MRFGSGRSVEIYDLVFSESLNIRVYPGIPGYFWVHCISSLFRVGESVESALSALAAIFFGSFALSPALW